MSVLLAAAGLLPSAVVAAAGHLLAVPALLAAPTPAPSGEVGSGGVVGGGTLEPSDIGPGITGFLATFGIVLVSVLVLVSMVRRLRRMEHRRRADEVAEEQRRRETGAGRPGDGDLP